VRDTLVDSLAKLQLDYVDLFLVHTPLKFYKEPGAEGGVEGNGRVKKEDWRTASASPTSLRHNCAKSLMAQRSSLRSTSSYHVALTT